MGRKQYRFSTGLDKATLLEIIAAQQAARLSNGIRGRVDGDRFTLSHCPSCHNAWAPVFEGRVQAGPEGVCVSGGFRVPAFTARFLALARGATLCLPLAGLAVLASNRVPLWRGLLSAVLLALPLLFTYLLEALGVRLGRGSQRKILRFLEERLKASPLEGEAEPQAGEP